jgi:hypothetical protein
MYAAFYLATVGGLSAFFGPSGGPIIAAFLAGPIVFALGWLLYRFIVARVTGAGAAQTEGAGAYGQILTTLGISLILQNGGLIVFGSAPTGIRTPLSRSSCDENAKCGGHVNSLRPAVSQHARRRPQHLQSPTPSRLTLDAPDLLSRGGEPMEKCGYCSEIACSARGYFCSTVVNLTMRAIDLTGSRAGATAQRRTAVCGCMTFGANQVLGART